MKITQWRLESKQERRFRAGHPWVYSNEIQGGPKGHSPGVWVRLSRADGAFLAWGYGNPNSLISFRALSRDPNFEPSDQGFCQLLTQSIFLRSRLGRTRASFRLCFGEADSLPGLVIDCFRVIRRDEKSWVLVIQSHTAGIDLHLPEVLAGLKKAWGESVLGVTPWDSVTIVLRRDLSVRKFEGIEEFSPEKLQGPLSISDLERSRIELCSGLVFECNLWSGQKTGFFLDQRWNTAILQSLLKESSLQGSASAPLRVLDLFCHLGQWGVAAAQALSHQSGLEVVFSDASAPAIDSALQNLKLNCPGISARGVQIDLIERLDQEQGKERIPEGIFDVVVCDPPALIKGKKALGPGTHAYQKINEAAMLRLRLGGIFVTCSCSSLLSDEEFERVLAKAGRRTGVELRWVARGGHAVDHPELHEFPEGKYLKAWVGVVVKTGST